MDAVCGRPFVATVGGNFYPVSVVLHLISACSCEKHNASWLKATLSSHVPSYVADVTKGSVSSNCLKKFELSVGLGVTGACKGL